MTCSDFAAGQQKHFIKAWEYTVHYAVHLGNPSKPPGLDMPSDICETIRKQGRMERRLCWEM